MRGTEGPCGAGCAPGGVRRFLRGLLHPERYHGFGRDRGPFFEGWYYKLIDASARERYAVIPGIFRGERPGEDHAFVQVLDGMSGRSSYHRYPVEAFEADEHAFSVRVDRSRFDAHSISLAVGGPERSVQGELRFSGQCPWPVRLTSPGIMGWYAWVPLMECYHGVVSLDHSIHGTLHVDGRPVAFDDGRGYIEKDWGKAFPSAYVWLQTNHFDVPGTSVTASVAMIPWVRRRFRGFIAGLWHAGTLHRFATYTGARIETLRIDDAQVTWSIRDRTKRLELRASRATGGLLHSPVRTQMHKRVDETLRSRVETRLCALEPRGERVIFEGVGESAGLEVHGDLDALLQA
jgi:hypothetical protein